MPVCAESLQSCLTLRDPGDCSPPGSSVRGILQARVLECVAMPSAGDLPDPGIEPTSLTSPALAGGFFTASATKVAHAPWTKKNFFFFCIFIVGGCVLWGVGNLTFIKVVWVC